MLLHSQPLHSPTYVYGFNPQKHIQGLHLSKLLSLHPGSILTPHIHCRVIEFSSCPSCCPPSTPVFFYVFGIVAPFLVMSSLYCSWRCSALICSRRGDGPKLNQSPPVTGIWKFPGIWKWGGADQRVNKPQIYSLEKKSLWKHWSLFLLSVSYVAHLWI